MEREILRQLPSQLGFADLDGRLFINGLVDLASLASVTEIALRSEFKL